MIDLRSDTVTRPTKGMLEAMCNAQVGDDVFMEDPTITALEKKTAALFGMEAGLFCPSGTMTNQIAIKVHTQPGDELICSRQSHIYCYEGGGIAYNSGVSARLIEGESGLITAEEVRKNINPDDIHFPVTTLVSLENTSNRGGGLCYKKNELEQIAQLCQLNNLRLHLDGARLFNAIVAKGENPTDYGRWFDSISICLSKGLGAPAGSVLIGNVSFIQKARRVRKVMGGGMRQAGYLAAAGIYALDNHVERLKIDHENVERLAQAASENKLVQHVEDPQTNIVRMVISPELTGQEFVDKLRTNGVLAMALGPQMVRLVTHLDISAEQIETVAHVLKNIR
jgi:threonine aldolase